MTAGLSLSREEGSCINACHVTLQLGTAPFSPHARWLCCLMPPLSCGRLRGAVVKRQGRVQFEPCLQLPDRL